MKVLFYGHSVLANYPLTHLGPYEIDNVAQCGATAEGRLKKSYDKIILMFGMNELAQGLGQANPTYWMDKTLSSLTSYYAPSQILLALVMKNLEEDPSVDNHLIEGLNRSLRSLGKQYQVPIFDWQSFYNERGYVRPELTLEGIHLSSAG